MALAHSELKEQTRTMLHVHVPPTCVGVLLLSSGWPLREQHLAALQDDTQYATHKFTYAVRSKVGRG